MPYIYDHIILNIRLPSETSILLRLSLVCGEKMRKNKNKNKNITFFKMTIKPSSFVSLLKWKENCKKNKIKSLTIL